MTKNGMHRLPAKIPLGYFITIRTYGTWLPGDERGWVDKEHNIYGTPKLAPHAGIRTQALQRMRDHPYLLHAHSAALVEQTIREVCAHRGWYLWVVNARTNHVHTVLRAPVNAERIMNDFKTWATRRLREKGFAGHEQTVWSDHGSTPHLWTQAQLAGAIEYVRNWQGGPLQRTWDEVRREIDGAPDDGS